MRPIIYILTILLFTLSFESKVQAQNCLGITLADTIHACPNTQVPLNASLTNTTPFSPILDTVWTPAAGLSATNILNPIATIGNTSTSYTLTVRAVTPQNLVLNGDFSSGISGFTSQYTVGMGGTWGPVSLEGTYGVGSNPTLLHSNFATFGDHTTGTGNMMVINGSSTPNVNIWCQTINVVPNTYYNFSAWGASCTPTAPAILQFAINGNLLGTPLALTSTLGLWTEFNALWFSGNNTSITICITDQQTAASGNDFAIDDISFQQVCTTSKSVYVDVSQMTPSIASDVVTCGNGAVNVSGSSLGNVAPVQYSWIYGDGTTGNGINATHTYTSVGTYTDTLIVHDSYGCSDTTTHQVTVNNFVYPVTISHTIPLCSNGIINLSGNPTSGTLPLQYTWLYGDGSAAETGQYVTHTYSTAGIYNDTLIAIYPSGCSDTAIQAVNIDNFTAPATIQGIPIMCQGKTTQLSVGPLGSTYSWTPTTGLDNPVSPTPNASPDVTTTYTATVVFANGCMASGNFTLTVIPPPPIKATMSNIEGINCMNAQVKLYASGGATYLWQPSSLCSDFASPETYVSPTKTTTFILTGVDENHCINTDTITVNVNLQGSVFVPSAFSPNGDGKNDILRPIPYCGFKIYEFSVYNRWGQQLYYSQYPTGWDGNYNGQPADIGTYYYYLIGEDYNGNQVVNKGQVELIR